MQGTMPGAGRPRTTWMDNIKTWTVLPVEQSIRITEIRGESTSMVWPTLGWRSNGGQLKNRIELALSLLGFIACIVYGYSSSQSNLPHRYGNSHAIWDHTVLPATRQS